MASIPDSLREQVSQRASGLCEYCHALLSVVPYMEVDHIIPTSRGGATSLDNLRMACTLCNGSKQNHQTGIDPESGSEFALLNPRVDTWRDHFQWDGDGVRLIGLTPVGRTTIERLRMNRGIVLSARRYWVRGGWHPPPEDI